jgi:hypothetical protein
MFCKQHLGQESKSWPRQLCATKAKGTYLRDKFYRLKARRGYKRAVVAVAHKILVAIYHMLFPPSLLQRIGPALPRQAQQAYLEPGSSPVTFRLHRHIGVKGRMTSVPLAHTGCQLNPIFIAAGVRKLSAENR